jgi:hypothetical protein
VPAGAAFGIIWGSSSSGGHAFNFYVTPYLEVKLIEPQSGRPIQIGQWIPYFAML